MSLRQCSREMIKSFARSQSSLASKAATYPIKLQQQTELFPKLENVKLDDLMSKDGTSLRGTYFIDRSETGNLPVYSDVKSGGTRVITEIRKIRGDIMQLRNDLQEKLPFIPKDKWKVFPRSSKIIISGDAVKEVKIVLSKSF